MGSELEETPLMVLAETVQLHTETLRVIAVTLSAMNQRLAELELRDD